MAVRYIPSDETLDTSHQWTQLCQKRSEQMLEELESRHSDGRKKGKEDIKAALNDSMQLSFFQLNDPVLEQIHEELKNVDINGLTPMDALLKLNEIKKLIGN